MKRINKAVSLLVLIGFLTTQSSVAAGRFSLGGDTMQKELAQSSVSEFVYQRENNDVLMPVYLLGAVGKPGVYHIPPKMDLISLLALAGGTLKEAETEHVVLKRQLPNQKQEVKELNLEDMLRDERVLSTQLASNDVIYVSAQEPAISNNTVVTITIIGSVIGIVLSGILLSQAIRK